MRSITFTLTLLMIALLITACGGGSDDSSTAAEITPEAAPETVVLAKPAPRTVAPTDGTLFEDSRNIKLEWDWHQPLAEDEYFDVRVWRPGDVDAGITWVKDTEADISAWMAEQGYGHFLWSVTAVVAEFDANGQPIIYDEVSGDSPIRRFGVFTAEMIAQNLHLTASADRLIDAELAAAGEVLYNEGLGTAVPSCLSCHIPDAEVLLAPSLIGTWDVMAERDPALSVREYIEDSLHRPDRIVPEGFYPGVMFQTYGTTLTPEQIEAIVEYTASLAAQ